MLVYKKCPKCGKEIPQHWWFHADCGWKETETSEVENNEKDINLENDLEKPEDILNQSVKIGTIGSPSSAQEMSLNILDEASVKKLIGQLVAFKFLQDNRLHFAMGQVTNIKLRNTWLEMPSIQSLSRFRGFVNPVSQQQDIHTAEMKISAVFAKDEDNRIIPSSLGTVPPTGTYVHVINNQFLDSIFRNNKEDIFYLGKVYASEVKMPFWFKHFGSGHGGVGEAYHIGIFGKTGSGKSVLAKMILLGYAKNKNMGIFIIDPQGEFSKDAKGNIQSTGFVLDFGNILKKQGRQLKIFGLNELVLDDWEIFSEILFESKFFEKLTIPKNENRKLASDVIKDKLVTRNIKLEDIYRREIFDTVIKLLNEENVQKFFYRSIEARKRFSEVLKTFNLNLLYSESWRPVAKLFSTERANCIKINELISQALLFNEDNKPIVIIDLSREQIPDLYWNENIEAAIINKLLQNIIHLGSKAYIENKNLNTLVVFDEAHRFASKHKYEESEYKEQLRQTLIDAVRTTRKYGLGWLFISQTLSSLHKDIVHMMRVYFFGFGLSLGDELWALREIAGGDESSIRLYQSFRDPHSALDYSNREYSFMSVGPVSPLSFSGSPLFFTAFNTPEDFIKVNKLL